MNATQVELVESGSLIASLSTVSRWLADSRRDRAAADAVRTRINWKYAIGLSWKILDSITRCCASFGPG